jgi:hypothetical protein
MIVAAISFILFAIMGAYCSSAAEGRGWEIIARTRGFYHLPSRPAWWIAQAISVNIDMCSARSVLQVRSFLQTCELRCILRDTRECRPVSMINEAWARFDLVRVRYLVKRLAL